MEALPNQSSVVPAAPRYEETYDTSEAEDKESMQLMRQSFKATIFASASPLSERPLCLDAIACAMNTARGNTVIGKLPRDHPERLSQMFNDHPKFINAAILWLLSHSSDDAVLHSASKDLLPCTCDTSNPCIAMLHSAEMPPDGIPGIADSMFIFVEIMLFSSDTQKLDRIIKADRLKRTKRRYETLNHFILVDPRTLVQAACSWYKVRDCAEAISILTRFVELRTPDMDTAFQAMDPEIPLLIVQRAFDAVIVR
ncbi:hypothetical protein BDV98DRAFT_379977 [Pterulicium gracile]|uniref:Uncharacterized protein n=1 Tax=Pterulicium gracile TaxID=1884261 RepID=A0A5C3QSM0_9AGAR|nr:hypothetical protein BDV98DRAFT_379977 [Pterula gracilis]